MFGKSLYCMGNYIVDNFMIYVLVGILIDDLYKVFN